MPALKRIATDEIEAAVFLDMVRKAVGIDLAPGDSVKLLPAPDLSSVPSSSLSGFISMLGSSEDGRASQAFEVGGTYILTDISGTGMAMIATLDDWGRLCTTTVPAGRLEKLDD
jgi:hypothetical protein